MAITVLPSEAYNRDFCGNAVTSKSMPSTLREGTTDLTTLFMLIAPGTNRILEATPPATHKVMYVRNSASTLRVVRDFFLGMRTILEACLYVAARKNRDLQDL